MFLSTKIFPLLREKLPADTLVCKIMNTFWREYCSTVKPLRIFNSGYNHLSCEVIVIKNTQISAARPVNQPSKDAQGSILRAESLLFRRPVVGKKWQDPLALLLLYSILFLRFYLYVYLY